MLDQALVGDHAQDFLHPYLGETESLFRTALQAVDDEADCKITPAADLGFPADVVRFAGGFASGCLVEWSSSSEVVPVDTCTGVDTSSIFWLDDFPSPEIRDEDLVRLEKWLVSTSTYVWNFHQGNHFIMLVRRRTDGAPALVMHSSEGEFTYQSTGLLPGNDNWYIKDVVTTYSPASDRYIRLLWGDKASLYKRMSRTLRSYARDRHALVATMLLDGRARIGSEYHKQHFYMPSSNSAALGCYLCQPNEVVPIFSAPSRDIDMFRCSMGGKNDINLLNGRRVILVPHGWGRTMTSEVDCAVEGGRISLNGETYPVEPRVSIASHPQMGLREFDDSSLSSGSFYGVIEGHTPGNVIDSLAQIWSYSSAGYVHHSTPRQ
ncbi:hypothetical protein PHK61_06575 [Actinomycetospora lutea]|uniref:hypothetical protein n=1 Tax=Actinomycetospora lutea TaxID=663604 RepID=UPI002365A99F|nr:hypothetical protein [Actinomycetospora lutea]MDD7938080.1 hypothetical protein [Actinomycetospora lutea]